MQGNPSKPTEQQPAVVGAESASSEQEKVKDMDDEMEGDDVTRIADANACASSSSSSNSLRCGKLFDVVSTDTIPLLYRILPN